MEFERIIKARVAVLSIVVGLIFGFAFLAFFWVVGEGMREPYEPICEVHYTAFCISFWLGVICWASVWVIFFILRWIVRGFRGVTKQLLHN